MKNPPASIRAFTLIELLVIITIIGRPITFTDEEASSMTGGARTEHIAKQSCSSLLTPFLGVDWSQMVEQIRKHLENGFTPFALRLSDGRRFVVPHRDFVAVSSKVVVVIGEDELAVSINPLHIVSVEDVMPA